MTPSPRSRVTYGLLLLTTLFVVACGGSNHPVPAVADAPPDPERIQLKTTVSRQFYAVRGITTDAIFDYIGQYGPSDDKGQRGSGLTTSRWSYVWKGALNRSACGIDSITINLDLVVTLPQHAEPNALPAAIKTSWDQFAAGVNDHEQRHVDIYLDGAKGMKAQIAAITTKPSCDDLEKEIATVWSGQQTQIDAQQQLFHASEDARLQLKRAPLQVQIDANRSRLTALTRDLRALDATVQGLLSDASTLSGQIETLKSQLDQLDAMYPGGLPGSVLQAYESLRKQYNDLIARYNSLVDQYNAGLERRTAVSSQYDELQNATNSLVDSYNWMR